MHMDDKLEKKEDRNFIKRPEAFHSLPYPYLQYSPKVSWCNLFDIFLISFN